MLECFFISILPQINVTVTILLGNCKGPSMSSHARAVACPFTYPISIAGTLRLLGMLHLIFFWEICTYSISHEFFLAGSPCLFGALAFALLAPSFGPYILAFPASVNNGGHGRFVFVVLHALIIACQNIIVNKKSGFFAVVNPLTLRHY